MLQLPSRSGVEWLKSDSYISPAVASLQRMMRWKSPAVCAAESVISCSQRVSEPLPALCKADESPGCCVLVLAVEAYTV